MQEITIVKGAVIDTVTLYATNVAENLTNKIFLITPAQSTANQPNGPLDVKVVDLLRNVHQYVIKCYIAGTALKTAKQVKDDLKSIFNGAGVTGGVATLTYDGDTINGYIEKINFVEVSADSPSETIKDYGRYEVALTFVEGVST